MRRRTQLILAALALLTAWLCLWPVPVQPVAWTAPPNPGYTGVFTPNNALTNAEFIDLGAWSGPEDFAVDAQGRLHFSTHQGAIVRLDASGPTEIAHTGGRPLGLAFSPTGTLWVADAFRGLLAITPDGTVTLELSEVAGTPLRYADDLEIAPDGTIWLSDASTKFGAAASGDTLVASMLDILEHGGHGRLIRYDPATEQASEVLTGLNFANGIALDPQGAFVLVVETSSYRIVRHHLTGPRASTHDLFADALPGFPDNIEASPDGHFWVGLISPRNAIVDALDGSPFLRAMIQRLPAVVRPKPKAYGHLLEFDRDGRLLESRQDPTGRVAFVTGAQVLGDQLYISSLKMKALARMPRQR
jgi:sugar lactone lactonase YvrE